MVLTRVTDVGIFCGYNSSGWGSTNCCSIFACRVLELYVVTINDSNRVRRIFCRWHVVIAIGIHFVYFFVCVYRDESDDFSALHTNNV